MSQLRQMADGLGDSPGHIHENPRQSVDVAVDQDERATSRMRADALFVEARRREDEAIDLRRHLGEKNILPVRLLIRIAEEHREPGIVGARLRGADQGRKERIGDVGNDQRDVAGPPGAERPRDLVGHIAQPCRRFPHARGGFAD